MAENFWSSKKINKKLKHFKKHIRHIMHVDDDILSEEAKSRLDEILLEAESVTQGSNESISVFLSTAPERATRALPKKTFPALREWLDIIAVAVMVAFGIRALFLQPFKIPTSSMQPTLFGIHYIADKNTLPHLPAFMEEAIFGAERAKLVVEENGIYKTDSCQGFSKYLMFPWTRFRIGDKWHELPGKPDKVRQYALHHDTFFNKGDVVCDGWLSTGDHLFVDRFSHHFLGLKRGDVIVFNTEKIYYGPSPLTKKGYYYIKRLIGLPGDTLSIKNDMVYIKEPGEKEEKPITELNGTFKKIYSRKGGYHGHLNIEQAQYLSNPDVTFTVPEDSYFAMGDNSDSSFDSRYWGIVPRKNIVGKGFFIFWPYSRRWGVVDTKPAMNIETKPGFPAMNLQ